MREDLALKATILAEKFAPDLSWYVDVILQLIDKAGDFVSDDIWFMWTPTIPILLTTYAKILMHSQPPDPELQHQIWSICSKYESCIDAEIQQRAVEYFALSRKGEALMDILAEMPKFPERQSSLIKKAEDTEADTSELSAIKLMTQQEASNALVLADQRPANGTQQVSQLGMVMVPSTSNMVNFLACGKKQVKI